jgi:hypothetical protein
MKSTDFVVTERPRLGAIKRFPAVEFADYERRLAEMQETLQRVQQAYLSRDEAVAPCFGPIQNLIAPSLRAVGQDSRASNNPIEAALADQLFLNVLIVVGAPVWCERRTPTIGGLTDQ